MLAYHRGRNSDKVLSSGWTHAFNSFAYDWNPLSGFSRDSEGYKPYLLDFDLGRLFKPPLWIPVKYFGYWLLTVFMGQNIWNDCLVFTGPVNSRLKLALCGASGQSFLREGKAHVITLLLNSSHASVGPQWIHVWGKHSPALALWKHIPRWDSLWKHP